jgi:hypothetical protein
MQFMVSDFEMTIKKEEWEKEAQRGEKSASSKSTQKPKYCYSSICSFGYLLSENITNQLMNYITRE